MKRPGTLQHSNTRAFHRLVLEPVGTEVAAAPGTPLRDLLFEYGVEFPCGGQGRCRGCRVRVREGELPASPVQQERLSTAELAAGWRLACQCSVTGDLTLELRQWDAAILAGDAAFRFTPEEGVGIAVDLGTTTLVAQLLDLETGHVLAVRTALNPQARFGTDVMSRVHFAVAEGGQAQLEAIIRRQIGGLAHQLLAAAGAKRESLRRVSVVGNTVMHHLFCGLELEPLSRYPFESPHDGLQRCTAGELGWDGCGEPEVLFLPGIASFVGSDLLAGIVACGLLESDDLVVFIDLGTNGEIFVGNRARALCASTAAGPAFEGARIAAGMRAATGAIWKVAPADGGVACEVLGGGPPRGLCGSGLVDAVAAGLALGWISRSGRLADGTWTLAPPVALTQTDIRQLQLAKGAIAAGVRILLRRWGAGSSDVARVLLAGAFGNYIDRASAHRIGLLDFPPERIEPAGNTALLGAKLALFTPMETYDAARGGIEHVSLDTDPEFQEIFVEAMAFPAALSRG
jgi:uncharacterized 2Fe-2S/4Fe-4S cluster protein (DUF4445 family)